MMSELLTIEEASRYLRVSKTSLRRWTNEGRLVCVRVGRRNERRFRLSDLEGALQANPWRAETPADARDPIRGLDDGSSRGVPRHVSLHHAGRDELWRLFRPYLLHHVRRGAPVLYIHEEGARSDVVGRLVAEGIDPEALRERKLLRLNVPAEAYLRNGSFSPERMIDFMEGTILDFRASGHSASLISGEMTWFLTGAPGVDGMIRYEASLNALLRRYPDVTIVCHYDLDRLPSRITLGAVCTHHHVQLAERLAPGLA
jgi:excisionase family DNA binding protein